MSLDSFIALIDNGSSIVMAGMAVLQTFIIVISFVIGTRYLEQHKQKLLSESKIKLCDVTIRKLFEDILAFNDLIKIDYDEHDKLKTETDEESIEKLVWSFWARYEKNLPQMHQLTS